MHVKMDELEQQNLMIQVLGHLDLGSHLLDHKHRRRQPLLDKEPLLASMPPLIVMLNALLHLELLVHHRPQVLLSNFPLVAAVPVMGYEVAHACTIT